MSGGIAALEGFDYQAMVALELMLDHFASNDLTARARPEGVDDLDLEFTDENKIVHRVLVQIKKPRQNADGERSARAWTLSEVISELIERRMSELQDAHTKLVWILGDVLGDDAKALLGEGGEAVVWAVRRAAAEWLVRAQLLPDGTRMAWKIQAAAPDASLDDTQGEWRSGFERRTESAGFDAGELSSWFPQIEQAHRILDRGLNRVEARAAYVEAAELRSRLTQRLHVQFGLKERDVRDVVFRNLRGFVDDVARCRGAKIDLPTLENEIQKIWPRLVATVLPPPRPIPHLARRAWVESLARRRGGMVIGPSGAGKTTSATDLFHQLRATETDTVVLYAEVLPDTEWRNVLEGVAYAIGRRGDTTLYGLLPSVREGHDAALLSLADRFENSSTPVALVVDLVRGGASDQFLRDLARFVQRLPANPKTSLWVFGQEDALTELSDAERISRQVTRMSAPGLDWQEFQELARLLDFAEPRSLHPVYQALTAGGRAGIPPRTADAVLRLPDPYAALRAAESDDVLLAADGARYQHLPPSAREALGAVACIAHPFRVGEAEATFPNLSIRAGIRDGLRVGLLHSHGDGQVEFHETVRRTLLFHLPREQKLRNHGKLADVCRERGDSVLEAHHAESAEQAERARQAGRAAFFDPITSGRVALRAAARGWVVAGEILQRLQEDQSAPHGWWEALRHVIDDGTAMLLAGWWRDTVRKPNAGGVLWQAPRVLISARPAMLSELLDIVASAPEIDDGYYGSSALGSALHQATFDEAVVLARFERGNPQERLAMAGVLRSSGRPKCIARWLRHVFETDAPPQEYSEAGLSDAHIEAIAAELPATDAMDLVMHRDWGFGAATAFLWRNRVRVGAGAARLLKQGDLAPGAAGVTMRLLGVTNHPDLLEIARRWARSEGPAQQMALAAPLLVDAEVWREELSSIVLDPSMPESTRAVAFGTRLWSDSSVETLLAEVTRLAPSLGPIFRRSAAISFLARPSLFALDALVKEVTSPGNETAVTVLEVALARAAYFADGPDAAAAAARILPLLQNRSLIVRKAVLIALVMLRQSAALEPCLKLSTVEAGTEVGRLACIAACSSWPESLDDVRAALDANPDLRWLTLALAGRFDASELSPVLVHEACKEDTPWSVRRQALLTLERWQDADSVHEAVEGILSERSMLGRCDSIEGQLSQAILECLHRKAAFVSLWGEGEDAFVARLTPVLVARRDHFPAAPEQIDECLRVVWRYVDDEIAHHVPMSMVLSSLTNAIQLSQVQHSALRVARAHGHLDLIERVLGASDAPWLVVGALSERMKVDPRTPAEAATWTKLVENGPCGLNTQLLSAMRNVLRPVLEPVSPRQSALSDVPAQRHLLTAAGFDEIIEETCEIPPNVQVAEMSQDVLAYLIERLEPAGDSLVEVERATDAELVALTEHGFTRSSPSTRSTGRSSHRGRLRALLVARYPADVPAHWLTEPRCGRDFISSLMQALGNEGNPGRALVCLRRISADVLRSRGALDPIAPIADKDLVNWICKFSGVGGPDQLGALASFVRRVTDDAVLPLLGALMHRIDGHMRDPDIMTEHSAGHPVRLAFVDVLTAKRLRDVPGAAEWLVRMLGKIPHGETIRMSVVDAMARFPATWWQVETEACNSYEYAHRFAAPRHVHFDKLANGLFWSPGGGKRRQRSHDDVY